jgi:hypothetical protein
VIYSRNYYFFVKQNKNKVLTKQKHKMAKRAVILADALERRNKLKVSRK